MHAQMAKEDVKLPKDEDRGTEPYQPPDFAWEELWEPVALALTCARERGNPGCGGGPFGS